MIGANEARKLTGSIDKWRIKIDSAIKSGTAGIAFVEGIPGQFYDQLVKELVEQQYVVDEIRSVVPDNVIPLHLIYNESVVSLLIKW